MEDIEQRSLFDDDLSECDNELEQSSIGPDSAVDEDRVGRDPYLSDHDDDDDSDDDELFPETQVEDTVTDEHKDESKQTKEILAEIRKALGGSMMLPIKNIGKEDYLAIQKELLRVNDLGEVRRRKKERQEKMWF